MVRVLNIAYSYIKEVKFKTLSRMKSLKIYAQVTTHVGTERVKRESDDRIQFLSSRS